MDLSPKCKKTYVSAEQHIKLNELVKVLDELPTNGKIKSNYWNKATEELNALPGPKKSKLLWQKILCNIKHRDIRAERDKIKNQLFGNQIETNIEQESYISTISSKDCRQILAAVAQGVYYEKRDETEVLNELSKTLGFNCQQLWQRMHNSTKNKLHFLLKAEDWHSQKIAHNNMTITDWLLFDTILVHQDIDLIGMNNTTVIDKKFLIYLFNLVKQFKIEELSGNELAVAWSLVTVNFNKEGCLSTPMLLQRRWYQLKWATRKRFYKFWSIFKGKNANLARAERYTPTPLQTAIVKRYKSLILEPFMTWEYLITIKKVILRQQFELIAINSKQTNIEINRNQVVVQEGMVTNTNVLTTDTTHPVPNKIEPYSNNIEESNFNAEEFLNDSTVDNENCNSMMSETVIVKCENDPDLIANEPVLPKITSVFGNVCVTNETLSQLSLLTAHLGTTRSSNEASDESGSVPPVIENVGDAASLPDDLLCIHPGIPIREDFSDHIDEENMDVDTDKNENNRIPEIDEKLVMIPQVRTVKLDDMGILPINLLTHINSKSLIHVIDVKSKPIVKNKKLIKEVQEPQGVKTIQLSNKEVPFTQHVKMGELFNKEVLFTQNVKTKELSNKEVPVKRNMKTIRLSSMLFQKPRKRFYNFVQLKKNPDFNIKLKNLHGRFLRRINGLLKKCKPLTVDVSKAFESKLVNGVMYLNTNDNPSDSEPENSPKDNNTNIHTNILSKNIDGIDISNNKFIIDKYIVPTPNTIEPSILDTNEQLNAGPIKHHSNVAGTTISKHKHNKYALICDEVLDHLLFVLTGDDTSEENVDTSILESDRNSDNDNNNKTITNENEIDTAKVVKKKNERKKCCWARERIFQTITGTQYTEHKCPLNFCSCCCSDVLAEFRKRRDRKAKKSNTKRKHISGVTKGKSKPDSLNKFSDSSLPTPSRNEPCIKNDQTELITYDDNIPDYCKFGLLPHLSNSGLNYSLSAYLNINVYHVNGFVSKLSIDQPLFPENLLLMTTAIFPSNFKMFEQLQSIVQRFLAPKDIQLILQPSGRVTIYRDFEINVNPDVIAIVRDVVNRFNNHFSDSILSKDNTIDPKPNSLKTNIPNHKSEEARISNVPNIQSKLGFFLNKTLTQIHTLSELRYAYMCKPLFFKLNLKTEELTTILILRDGLYDGVDTLVPIDAIDPKSGLNNVLYLNRRHKITKMDHPTYQNDSNNPSKNRTKPNILRRNKTMKLSPPAQSMLAGNINKQEFETAVQRLFDPFAKGASDEKQNFVCTPCVLDSVG